MILAIIRHGETRWNADGLFTGWADVALTEQGYQQARQAGAQLSAITSVWNAVYASKQERAVRTAKLALEPVDLRCDWRLNERHVGDLEGRHHHEIAASHGADQVAQWRWGWDQRPPAMSPSDSRQIEHCRRYGLADNAPLGEALVDVVARVRPWLEELRDRHGPGDHVAVFTHGTTLRALQVLIESLTPEEIRGIHPKNGAIHTYTYA